MWTNQIFPHQTHPTMSFCTLLCESGHSRAGIENSFPQTVHKNWKIGNSIVTNDLRINFTESRGPNP